MNKADLKELLKESEGSSIEDIIKSKIAEEEAIELDDLLTYTDASIDNLEEVITKNEETLSGWLNDKDECDKQTLTQIKTTEITINVHKFQLREFKKLKSDLGHRMPEKEELEH